MMKSFVASVLLSFLLASAVSSNSLKSVDRATCEEECAAQGGSPVCDVNGMQFPNRCNAENCASVRKRKSCRKLKFYAELWALGVDANWHQGFDQSLIPVRSAEISPCRFNSKSPKLFI